MIDNSIHEELKLSWRTEMLLQSEQMNKHAERTLVKALQAGDEDAYMLLYSEYYTNLYSYCFGRLRNHADAEDAAQETLIATVRDIGRFRFQSRLLYWMYGVAKNLSNSIIRKQSVQRGYVKSMAADMWWWPMQVPQLSPESALLMEEKKAELQEMMAEIASKDLEVFFLRHLNNFSINEIGEQVSKSNWAVRSALYRVKRTFIAKLAE